MDMIADKIPPQNIEAERALLGACLLDKDALTTALETVKSDDFYREDHQIIYAGFYRLVAKGMPCDLITIVDELENSGQLEAVGGATYLASLSDAVPSASAAGYYANIVREKAVRRSLIRSAANVVNEGYSSTHSVESLLEVAEKSIFDASMNRTTKSFYPMGEVVVDVFEHILQIKASDGVTGVPTYRDLDNMYLSGLQKGDLIILAARPGMGKTSMALNIAQRASVNHGLISAIFSLEMPKEQLVQRMLCAQAKVDQSKIRSGMASKEDIDALSDALTPLAEGRIFMDDTPGINIVEMRSKLRKLKMEQKGLDLVVVDYLQLMRGAGKQENRQQEISEISRSLKALAKEMDVPVLALSQLSRLAERANEPPNLSHLRESGALEQDADIVMFIHRPQGEEDDAPQGVVDVIVAKHRNGAVGSVKMTFIAKYTTFENLTQEWVSNQE